MNTNSNYTLSPDSAGIIYPYVAEDDWCSVYRIESKLKKPLNLPALKSAVEEMRKEYPYYFSKIARYKRHFVLVPGGDKNVMDENIYPFCRPFDIESEPLTRVIYDSETVAVEMFHVLADGRGGLNFFKELMKKYSRISTGGKIADLNSEHFITGKCDDIYRKMTLAGGKNVSRVVSSAYQLKKQPETGFEAFCIDADVSSLKSAAKKRDASVTEYLCALQMKAIFDSEKTGNKPVRISVPVDIRKFAFTQTDRNGSLYTLIGAKKKDARDIDSLIRNVKAQFDSTVTRENMLNIAYTNVKQADMAVFKALPIGLKKFVLNIGYTVFGENQFTSTLTNPGIIDVGAEISDAVSDVYFILGKQKTKPVNIAVSTFNSRVKLMVSSDSRCSSFTNWLMAYLKSDGVNFKSYRVTNNNAKPKNENRIPREKAS